MQRPEVNDQNIARIENELEYALDAYEGTDRDIIDRIVSEVLDTAEREGHLNEAERTVAYDFLKQNYGYNF